MESTILGPVLFVVAVQWWLLQASNGDIGEIDRLKRQRNEERSGRILAQQKLRELRNKESNSKGFVLEPIAYLESPFLERRGTPRQPMLVPAAKARIRFVKQRIQHEHFAELKEFSHLWVVFMFHENTNVGTTIAARIKPPRLYGKRVGCLSSRSPHRPNPIGLSVCEILEVGADYIDIGCVDMMHGTPILDGKHL